MKAARHVLRPRPVTPTSALEHISQLMVAELPHETKYAYHRALHEACSRGEGFTYVVEFSSGVIKVGMTKDPWTRINQYRNEAATYGATVANSWISWPHVGHDRAERELIQYCRSKASAVRGKEYFSGISFADITGYAVLTTLAAMTGKPIADVTVAEAEEQSNKLSALQAEAAEELRQLNEHLRHLTEAAGGDMSVSYPDALSLAAASP